MTGPWKASVWQELPKDVVMPFGQVGTGCANRDDGHSLGLSRLLHLHRNAAGNLANEGESAVGHQLFGSALPNLRLGIAVADHQLNLLAVYAASLVELFDSKLGELDAVFAPWPKLAVLARHEADLDRVGRDIAAGRGRVVRRHAAAVAIAATEANG